MANRSLAAQPLLSNDIPFLVQLFEESFDYYIAHDSPFFKEYLQALRTLAGLGFSASLVDRSLLCIYQIYLSSFMAHGEGDFKANRGAKTLIAQHTAEMVRAATISFHALHYPRYYNEFIEALHYTISKIPSLSSQDHEAKRILAYLSMK